MSYLNFISLSWSAKTAARRTSNSFNLDSNSSFKFCSSTAKSSSLCLLKFKHSFKIVKGLQSLEAREAWLSSAGGLDVWQGSEEEVSKTEYVGDFEKNVLESGKQLTLCGRGLAVRPPILTAIPFFSWWRTKVELRTSTRDRVLRDQFLYRSWPIVFRFSWGVLCALGF